MWANASTVNGLELIALGLQGSSLFVATKGEGVFMSPDTLLYCLSSGQGNLFVGTAHGGMYRSSNSGRSWTDVNNGTLDTVSVFKIAYCNGYVFALASREMYYSADKGGGGWKIIRSHLFADETSAITSVGVNLFLSTFGDVNFLSCADSLEPDMIMPSVFDSPVLSFAVDGNKIYALTSDDKIYLNWSPINMGLPRNVNVYALAGNGKVFFAGIGKSIYRSFDNGENWKLASQGLLADTVRYLILNDDGLFAGTCSKGIFLSIDQGTSWTDLNAGISPGGYCEGLVSCGSSLVTALLVNNSISNIYHLTKNPMNWEKKDSTLVTKSLLQELVSTGSRLIAVTDNRGLLMSDDIGNTWSSINSDLVDTVGQVSSAVAKGPIIIAGTLGQHTPKGMPGWSYFAGSLWRSENGGLHWTKTTDAFDWGYTALTQSDHFMFMAELSAGTYQEAFISKDTGKTWASCAHEGLPKRVLACAEVGRYLYAGLSEEGLWRIPLSDISPIKNDHLLPSAPCREIRVIKKKNSIRFIFAGNSKHEGPSLRLFSISGKLLSRTPSSAEGGGEAFSISYSSLPAGVYIYKINFGNLSRSDRIVVAK
jgi:photosystem II stability/assembly factor-like uncharacterized protein